VCSSDLSFGLGRRRRRVVRIVKKKLPTVFTCPRCGEEAVRVTIDKQTGHATVLCALCQLKDEFPAHPAAQMIDVYSYFTDRFYGVKDPRAIIPRERELKLTPKKRTRRSLIFCKRTETRNGTVRIRFPNSLLNPTSNLEN